MILRGAIFCTSICFAVYPLAAEPSQVFEKAAREESLRQKAADDTTESIDVSPLESAKESLTTPKIHLPQTPPKIRQPDKEEEADEVSDEKQWLLSGVLKLEGRYGEELTEEQKQTLQERRERLGNPPRFIDHMAELKQKQYETAEALAQDIENQFAAEAMLESNDSTGMFADKSVMLWRRYGPDAVPGFHQQEGWRPSTVPSSHDRVPPLLPEQPKANPFLSDTMLLPSENRFITQSVDEPTPLQEVSKPEHSSSPILIPDAPAIAPTEQTRRYRPAKEIDEKYFKDLKRF